MRTKGRCDLCRSVAILVRDHNHKTNMVRGKLCYGCNMSLTARWDDPDWRSRALVYLGRDLGIPYGPIAKKSPKAPKRERPQSIPIGSNLRARRMERGISVQAAAKGAGITRFAWANWENDKRVPRFSTVRKVIGYLRTLPLLPDLLLKV